LRPIEQTRRLLWRVALGKRSKNFPLTRPINKHTALSYTICSHVVRRVVCALNCQTFTLRLDKQLKQSHMQFFSGSSRQFTEIEVTDRDSYRSHPCLRDCVRGEQLTCNYEFVVEAFETMSKACYNCPRNTTDCHRPHCITGDGMKRSIVVVNRMMPGPVIEVCDSMRSLFCNIFYFLINNYKGLRE
jgi:hypothetical protein